MGNDAQGNERESIMTTTQLLQAVILKSQRDVDVDGNVYYDITSEVADQAHAFSKVSKVKQEMWATKIEPVFSEDEVTILQARRGDGVRGSSTVDTAGQGVQGPSVQEERSREKQSTSAPTAGSAVCNE
jgi:hypothetical protein